MGEEWAFWHLVLKCDQFPAMASGRVEMQSVEEHAAHGITLMQMFVLHSNKINTVPDYSIGWFSSES